MDPSDQSKDRSEDEKEPERERQTGVERGDQITRKRSLRILIRCFVSFSFSVVGSFLLSLLVGIAALSIGNLSASTSVSVPSTCKILSSSVDLRSSKICELGLLNYKAKHVFYPSEKRRFRCRDDYYWASIFQIYCHTWEWIISNLFAPSLESVQYLVIWLSFVLEVTPNLVTRGLHLIDRGAGNNLHLWRWRRVEYKEYFSGQTFQAVAEAPKEALPHYCRPDFNTAWLAQSKFKVNETYNCRYTLGNWKADIYSDDNLFNCQAEEPSLIELIKRLSILFIQSSLSYNVDSRQMLLYAFIGVVAGILSGLLASFFGIVLRKSIHGLFLCISSKHCIDRAFATWLKRICLFIAYFSALGWLTIQYGQFIGLKQLVLGSGLKDWLI